MRIVCNTQRTTEWLQARTGKVCASEIASALDFLKRGGESQKRKDYKTRIVAETLTGQASVHYVSAPMEWGAEYEDAARAAYEVRLDREIKLVGFALHPTIDRSGASADGLIAKDGGLEIKCPNTTTHLEWILADVVPQEHVPQMQWNMVCWEREWWDFGSYDPRLPEHLQLFTKRLQRDNELIGLMENGVRLFLEEVDNMLAVLPKAPAKQEQSLDAIKDELQAMWISEAEVQAHNSRA